MDPDSSLAAVVLGLAMVFYGLLSLTEGYLWPRLRGGPAGEDSLLHPALWDETTRSLIKAGLIAATVASGAYLLLSLDFTWWAACLPGCAGRPGRAFGNEGAHPRHDAMASGSSGIPSLPSADIRRFGSGQERRGHDGHFCPVQPIQSRRTR